MNILLNQILRFLLRYNRIRAAELVSALLGGRWPHRSSLFLFQLHLPHAQVKQLAHYTTHTYIKYQFYIKMIAQVHLKSDLVRKKSLDGTGI